MSQQAPGKYGIILKYLWTNLATQIGGSLDETHKLIRSTLMRKRNKLEKQRAASLDMLRQEHAGAKETTRVSDGAHDAQNLVRALDSETGMTWQTFIRALASTDWQTVTVTVTCSRVTARGKTESISAEVTAGLSDEPKTEENL
jgi:hypothetical protein